MKILTDEGRIQLRNKYTQTTSKVGIWAMRKLSQFDDYKSPNINNMEWLMIAEFRCFGAAEMPTFEVVWV